MSEHVRIIGLDHFRRGISGMRRSLDPRVRHFLSEAAHTVADSARPRIPIGPAIGGHAVTSLTPYVRSNSAGVYAGGSLYPYYAWLDFGGTISPRGTPIHRPYLKKGRYIWKAFSEERKPIMVKAQRVVGDLGVSFGIDVERD
jgi:hypothetical protein